MIEVLDTSEATPEMIEAIKIMEQIREHNSKLRNLGQSWYENSEQLCEMSDKTVEDLESEIKGLEREVEDLKWTVKNYESELSTT